MEHTLVQVVRNGRIESLHVGDIVPSFKLEL